MVIGKSEVYFLMKTAYVLDSNKTYISAKQVADNYQLQPNETFYEPDTSAFPPYHLEGTKGVGIDYETFLTKNNIKIGDWYPELGVVGPKGPKGDPGPQGAQGMQGPVGPAPVIVVGTVTIGKPGTQPSVTFEKVDGGYKANFVIPQGEKGEKGDAPVLGKDYWTPADQQAIKDDVTKIVGDAYAKAKSEVEDAVANGKY